MSANSGLKRVGGKLLKDGKPFVIATDCSADFKAGRMAVQADKDFADINKIVARMEKSGVAPVLDGEPFYGDVSEFDGLQDAFIKAQKAQEWFMQFPASVREKFENDPTKIVSFLEDPANLDEAVSLGLVVKPVPEQVAPPVPPVVAPPPVVK